MPLLSLWIDSNVRIKYSSWPWGYWNCTAQDAILSVRRHRTTHQAITFQFMMFLKDNLDERQHFSQEILRMKEEDPWLSDGAMWYSSCRPRSGIPESTRVHSSYQWPGVILCPPRYYFVIESVCVTRCTVIWKSWVCRPGNMASNERCDRWPAGGQSGGPPGHGSGLFSRFYCRNVAITRPRHTSHPGAGQWLSVQSAPITSWLITI